MKRLPNVVVVVVGVLLFGAVLLSLAVTWEGRQSGKVGLRAPATSPLQTPTAPGERSPLPTPTPVPPTPPGPNATDLAICARHAPPPYPISLTPCPYYLTPPAEPVVIFTPAPRPTAIVPQFVIGAPTQAPGNGIYRLLAVVKEYQGPGELCDLHTAPNQQRVALFMCNTEGVSAVIIADPFTHQAVGQSWWGGWFRGWFPDSQRFLLMADGLDVVNAVTGESQRITPAGEMVTEAAVSSDGQYVAYTRIQGDRVRIINTSGNVVRDFPAPSPKPGTRPEAITWSPDGQRLAFIWDKTTIQFNIYGPLWVLEIGSGQQTQLSPSNVYDGYPVWSPDSERILVVRRDNIADRTADFDLAKLRSSLWIVNVTTREWQQTSSSAGGAWSPHWTPDGSAVIFMSSLPGHFAIQSVDANGSNLQELLPANDLMLRAFSLIQ